MGSGAAAYLAPSQLSAEGDHTLLGLETALGFTPSGLVDHPAFFSGFVARPEVVAAGILTVADVAATRYFDLAAIRAASLDPVVTASGDRLRFESFSACNGVHARFDLTSEGIDSGTVAFGTTNVDVNQPLRVGLASVGRAALLHVAVGPDELRVSTPDASHVERKVDLPDRWVRGFAEVPGISAAMTQRIDLPGARAAAFLGQLPRGAPGPTIHVAPTPAGLRVAPSVARGAVPVAGTARLTAARRIAPFATRVEVHVHDTGSTAWVFHVPGGRLTLVLSAAPHRGFSGEGGLLDAMSQDRDAVDAAARLLEHLAWEPRIDVERLGVATGLPADRLRSGIAHLSASGKVGYDLVERAWFHRELPHEPDRVLKDNPRLAAARALVESGAVMRDGRRWVVAGERGRHWVSLEDDTCTCEWWARYRGQRGPCKHALAASIVCADE